MRMTVRQAYTTLGVTHGASEDEARTAYRRLALQFHPDKNPHAEATAKFQEISAAYKKICDFHKHGGNQRGSFFFDDENGDDDVAGFGGFDDDDEFGFGGMDFDDLEPTFEEMLMMFEMMFGPAMPSVGKSNKKKKNKKKKKNATAPETAAATAAAAEAPTEAEPQPKVAVPLGKARRRKAPLGKQRGRNMFGGMDDFMDPEMMLFEQFMGMSMNDPELNDMEGDLMEEMMHLFAGASDDDLFDLVGGGRGPRKTKGAKSRGKKAASRRAETSDDDVEEVSDWEDAPDDDQKPASPSEATPQDSGNQDDDKRLNDCPTAISINSRVAVHGKLLGTVKFVGSVHYAKGEFLGVELDESEGKNDGTLKGVRYFTCKPRHGVMLRPQDVVAAPSHSPAQE